MPKNSLFVADQNGNSKGGGEMPESLMSIWFGNSKGGG